MKFAPGESDCEVEICEAQAVERERVQSPEESDAPLLVPEGSSSEPTSPGPGLPEEDSRLAAAIAAGSGLMYPWPVVTVVTSAGTDFAAATAFAFTRAGSGIVFKIAESAWSHFSSISAAVPMLTISR